MPEQTFKPGEEVLLASDSPTKPHSAFFEDDGETAYFYACNDDMVLDALHIYNVANVTDRDRPSTLSIIWSTDGMKCALLINGYAHAAFNFEAKHGFCRTNFPNFDKASQGCWDSSDHSWPEDAIAWMKQIN